MSRSSEPVVARKAAARFCVWLCLMLLAAPAVPGERATPVSADALRVVLGEHQGRVVLVNFWATWCRPCLDEIPALMALADEFNEQGFDLIAVSLDDPADRELLLDPFLDKWFPDFSTYVSLENDMDSIVSIVDPFWNEILPTSYVLARDGSVARRIQGGSSAEAFAAAIQPLLTRESHSHPDNGPDL